MKRSWGGEVQNVSVLVAVGVNEEGYREILGVTEGSREDKESWSNFLRYLKDRGLKGVKLIVSDKCLGLYEIIGDFFPDAKWQRCIVHWYRNAFTMCPWKHIREVVAMLKAIHAQEDKDAAKQKAVLVAEKLRSMRLEKAAEFVEKSVDETLSYMDFPYEHWSRLLERIIKEIRRRICNPSETNVRKISDTTEYRNCAPAPHTPAIPGQLPARPAVQSKKKPRISANDPR